MHSGSRSSSNTMHTGSSSSSSRPSTFSANSTKHNSITGHHHSDPQNQATSYIPTSEGTRRPGVVFTAPLGSWHLQVAHSLHQVVSVLCSLSALHFFLSVPLGERSWRRTSARGAASYIQTYPYTRMHA